MQRALLTGALVWALFSIVHVLISGVVVDEVAEAAQVISGEVQFPPGHPLPRFFFQAFSLPNFLSAAFLEFFPDALQLSSLRNAGFLFLSTFVPYALAVVLVRKPVWGHVAACMALCGVSIQFSGNYPGFVFPTYYSHGHFGFYLVLLAVALLLGRLWSLAGFLIGILPSVHPVTALVIWPWVGLWLAFSRTRPVGRNRRTFFLAAFLGLAVCCGFALARYLLVPELAISPPYDVAGDSALIAANFTRFIDAHNFPIVLRSMGYLANPATFLLLVLWLQHAGPACAGNAQEAAISRSDYAWILALGAMIWMMIFGLEGYRQVTGSWPDVIYMLMPSRFSNLTANLITPLLAVSLAVSIGRLERERRLSGELVVSGLLLTAGAVLLFNRTLVAHNLYYLVFALVFAIPVADSRGGKFTRVAAVLAVLMLAAAFWMVNAEAGPAIRLLAAWLVFLGVLRLPRPALLSGRFPVRKLLPISLLLVALASVSATPLLQEDKGYTRGEMMSAFDRELADWLSENARAGELLLPNILPVSHFMAKTGHPILFDLGTRDTVRYMPELAPAIGMMVRDLYGVDYTDTAWLEANSPPDRVDLRPLADSWDGRSLGEWQRLGKKYNFRLVITTRTRALDLPVMLEGDKWILYGIPQ